MHFIPCNYYKDCATYDLSDLDLVKKFISWKTFSVWIRDFSELPPKKGVFKILLAYISIRSNWCVLGSTYWLCSTEKGQGNPRDAQNILDLILETILTVFWVKVLCKKQTFVKNLDLPTNPEFLFQFRIFAPNFVFKSL